MDWVVVDAVFLLVNGLALALALHFHLLSDDAAAVQLAYCRLQGGYYALNLAISWRPFAPKAPRLVDACHHGLAALYLLWVVTPPTAAHAAWWTAAMQAPVGALLLANMC